MRPSPWPRAEKLGWVDAWRGDDLRGGELGVLLVVLLEEGGDVHVHGWRVFVCVIAGPVCEVDGDGRG